MPCILIITNRAKTLCRFRRHLIEELQRTGGLRVAALCGSDPGYDEKLQALGVELYRWPLKDRSLNPLGELRAILAVWRVVRRLRPALVQTYTIKAVLYGGLIARWHGMPLVSTITGLGYVFIDTNSPTSLLQRFALALYRLVLKHPRSRTVFLNRHDQAFFLEKGVVEAKRTVLIPGEGIDLEEWPPTPEPVGVPPLVVLPGRMLWQKGVGDFVEAGRLVREARVEARLALVGDIDAQDDLCVPQSRLRKWAAEGVVEWWGFRPDMAAVYAQSHIVCLPSYREGLPLVLLEAAACQRAVVATDVPGCRDVVEHGRTGLLVPPNDRKALAEALLTLIRDPEARARMGAEARARVRRDFSSARVVRATLDVYSTFLPTLGRRRAHVEGIACGAAEMPNRE